MIIHIGSYQLISTWWTCLSRRNFAILLRYLAKVSSTALPSLILRNFAILLRYLAKVSSTTLYCPSYPLTRNLRRNFAILLRYLAKVSSTTLPSRISRNFAILLRYLAKVSSTTIYCPSYPLTLFLPPVSWNHHHHRLGEFQRFPQKANSKVPQRSTHPEPTNFYTLRWP
jgi:hypothetical protein